MGIASVILGPWASIVAISIALLIQAVFFGDGGITCYGANCFNMAIVGSLAAYAVYRAISGRTAVTSPRRIAACALGGYVGINLSALCAAIEFGIQPALFHDASGSPLYAPYPLSVAIPAMLAAHLSLAGLAELVIGGALVAYLQRADPELLRRTAPGAAADGAIPSRLLDGINCGRLDRLGGLNADHAAWAAGNGIGLGRMGTGGPQEPGHPSTDRRCFEQHCPAGKCPHRPGEAFLALDSAHAGLRAKIPEKRKTRLHLLSHVRHRPNPGGMATGGLGYSTDLSQIPAFAMITASISPLEHSEDSASATRLCRA